MKKNDKNWFQQKIEAFKALPKEDKTTAYIFAGLIVFLIIAITVAVVLIVGTTKGKDDISVVTSSADISATGQELDADYKAGEFVIDEEKYADTFLQESADAGKRYLEDTLFIGDSNTLRLNSYGLFTLQNVLAVEGMGITNVATLKGFYFQGMEEGVTIPRAVAMLQPRRIVFNFGTNNADGSLTPPQFIASYKTALDAIKSEYPYSDIIISTIPPVAIKRDYNNLSMKTIDSFNKAIVDFAQEEGYKVLNYNSFLKADNGYIKPKYVVADGLHLTEDALKDILKYIRTHSYETKDNRPTLKAIPQRRKAPIVQAPSSSQALKAVSITFKVETRDKQGDVIDVIGGKLTSVDGGITQYVLPMESSKKMEAVANEGFTFGGWYWDKKISGEKSIVFTVPENITDDNIVIKAVFIQDVLPSPSPSLSPSPSPSVAPSPLPSVAPSVIPSTAPTATPAATPTAAPTAETPPTAAPPESTAETLPTAAPPESTAETPPA